MGFLTGNNYGSAQQAAGSSQQWAGAGSVLSGIGAVAGGIGQSQAYGYQAQVAKNNATIATANAQQDQAAGNVQESEQKIQTGLLVGKQEAAQGASGVDVNIGSPKAVRQSTQSVGALDAAMIHYNASREAYGQEIQATSDEAQAKLDQSSGNNALISSLFKGGASLLSGANSLSAKSASYRLSGASS